MVVIVHPMHSHVLCVLRVLGELGVMVGVMGMVHGERLVRRLLLHLGSLGKRVHMSVAIGGIAGRRGSGGRVGASGLFALPRIGPFVGSCGESRPILHRVFLLAALSSACGGRCGGGGRVALAVIRMIGGS